MVFGFFIGLVLIAIILVILFFIFWILMLVDCVKRDFKNQNEKIVWVIVIALLGIIGAAVYYFVVKISKDKKVKKK